MSEQLAIRPKASQQLAVALGMEPQAMLDVIKAQCFKGNPANVTNEQLAAFVSIANEMGVNPLLPGMLYAFPVQGGGIVPMMGPDGVYKKLSEHPEVDSWETEILPADVALPPTHAITRIYRKNREKPLTYTALLSEWKVANNPNWNSRPRHMLALRSLKQCARQIIHGVPYDEDERVIMGEINVTPGAETAPVDQVQRSTPPQRTKKDKGANTVPDTKPAAIEAEIVPDAPKVEPAKVEPKPAAKADPVEIAKSTTVYAEKETPVPAPVPEPAPANVPTARAFLKDGEAVQVKCTVKEITTLMVNFKGTPTPSVSLTLGGEYIGPALHIGGASGTPDKLTPNAPWAPGATVLVSLRGKANPASGGKVLVRVDEVKAIEASPANPAMDVE